MTKTIELIFLCVGHYLQVLHQLMNHWFWGKFCSSGHQLLPDAATLSLRQASGGDGDMRRAGRVGGV